MILLVTESKTFMGTVFYFAIWLRNNQDTDSEKYDRSVTPRGPLPGHPPAPCGWADWLILAFPRNELDRREGAEMNLLPLFSQNICFINQGIPGWCPDVVRGPAL